MRLFYLLFIFSVITISSAVAQNQLSGVVLDSLSRKPVPFASVFFVNTTVGAATDENGKFELKNFSSGKYDLVVSVLGYKTAQHSMTFEGKPQIVEIYIPQQSTTLDEVIVSPDTSNRAMNLVQFKRAFLGQSENSDHCRILNLKDLYLDFDSKEKILSAYAKKPIQIENKALGYKITYQLEGFTLNFGQGMQSYYGFPRFEEFANPTTKQLKKWVKERNRAYNGSFTHLIDVIRKDDLVGPFEIRELHRIPNPERPSEEFIKRRIKYWNENYLDDHSSDSIKYYNKLRRKPEKVDSIGKTFTKASELLDESGKIIRFKGMLRIVYKDEPEEVAYAHWNLRTPTRTQISVIHFTGDKLTLYDNGYYEDAHDLFFEGYMGWLEKISNLLPLGYHPVKN